MLARVAKGSASEGDWLVADRQTAGRGRLGRSWDSAAGNFHGSTVVALRPGDPSIGGLSLAVGHALFVAVGPPAYLKWPNDLLLRGAKVGGILLERQGDHVVIGFGVNLAYAPLIEGRETTCLDVDGGVRYTRDELLDRLIEWVPSTVAWWREHGTAAMSARWQGEAHPQGTRVTVTLPREGRIEGIFDGVTPEGALTLRLPSGAVRVIYSGEVALV